MQGCVQRVFFGDVNAATVRVLAAEGWEVHAPRRRAAAARCMMHAGVEDDGARARARDDRRLRGASTASRQRRRLRLGDEGLRPPARRRPEWARARRGVLRPRCATSTSCWPTHEPRAERHPLALKVAYHDACHLAHAQGVRAAAARAAARRSPASSWSSPPSGSSAAARRASTTSCSPRPPASSARARRRTSPPPAPRRSPPPTRAARCRSPAHLERPLPVYHPMTLLDHSIRGAQPVRSRMSLDVAPAPTSRLAEILSDDALAFVERAARRASARAAHELLAARASASGAARGRHAGLPRRRRARSARATGRSPPPRSDYEDRRVEITGPTDRKLVINALNSGAQGLHGRLRGRELRRPGRNQVEGHVNLIDAIEGTITYDERRRPPLRARRRGRDAARAPARLAPAREAPAGRRRADRRRAHGLRPLRVPLRPAAARPRPRRSTCTCRRWSTTSRRGCGTTSSTFTEEALGDPARLDPRHRADRDAARPRSRWTRSSTSCASTPTASTPAAGTTSSR